MKTYRRKSRKNPWRNQMERREFNVDALLGRLLLIGLPLMIICLATNITFRVTDTYQYVLNSSQVLSSVPVSEEDAVQLFGDYMKHKTSEFSLVETVEYEPEDVFSDADREAMCRLRYLMDIILVVGLGMLLLTGVCYFFLIRWRKKTIHMTYFKWSVPILLVEVAVWAGTKMIPAWRAHTWGKIFVLPKEDDLLAGIVDQGFYQTVTAFDLIISLVMLGILAYGTWEVAGRKKLFKNRKIQRR